MFSEKKLIGGYKYDLDDFNDVSFALSSFKEDLPISFQVTALAPVNLLSFLQQSAANTFYHPDIIGTTINNYGRDFGFVIK